MENQEPIHPEENKLEKPKSIKWDFLKKIPDHVKKISGVLGILIPLVFWYFLEETPKPINDFNSNFNKLTHCIPEDTISGIMQLNHQPLVGAIISFKVHNKNTDTFDEKDNIIREQNGHFKFSYCKDNSDKVEFYIITDANTKYVKPFPVNLIPTIINLN